jgi:recombination protein RecA
MSEKTDKLDRLKKLTEAINKDFGSGSVSNMEDKAEGIQWSSSGCIGIDVALGGGFPKGRIIEVYGPESSGKTTLAIHAMIEAQKDGVVGFVDAEHAFDLFYAQDLGLKTGKSDWLISQPSSGEEALEITEKFIRSGLFSMVVVDSVAALTPKAEIEGAMGDAKMGLQARLMSQAMRKLTSAISKSDTIVIFINQLRDKIGVMFGSPETTTGGNALKFYASVRVDIRRIGQNKDKDGNEVLSNKTRVKIVKNKVAPPFKKCEFDIVFGQGIDKVGNVLDLATDLEIIKKSGAWYSYEETNLAQGRAGAIQLLKDNPELIKEFETKVRKELGL